MPPIKISVFPFKLLQSISHNNCRRSNNSSIEAGFNLVQMVVTLTMIGILSAIAVPSISLGTNPLADTSNRIKSQIKLSRIKALSTTTAHRLKPISKNQIEIQKHLPQSGSSPSTCQDEAIETDGAGNPLWKTIEGYDREDFTFEEGIQLTRVFANGAVVSDVSDWQLCFSSRGISNQTIELELTQLSNREKITVEAFMGGSISIK